MPLQPRAMSAASMAARTARGLPRRTARDRFARIVAWGFFALALAPLAWILGLTAARGGAALTDPGFLSGADRPVLDGVVLGGVLHALVGTLAQAGATVLVAVPLGVLTGIYLVEIGRGRLATFTEAVVDVLAGMPPIVAGLSVFALWVLILGWSRTPLAVCLALILLLLPIVVRVTADRLRRVPEGVRESAYALGVSRWRTLTGLVLPSVAGGITSGVLLGLARVMGEMAPLLVLGTYLGTVSADLHGPGMATLPGLIEMVRTTPAPAATDARMWGAAATLLLLVLATHLVGVFIGRRTLPAWRAAGFGERDDGDALTDWHRRPTTATWPGEGEVGDSNGQAHRRP